MKLVSSTYKLSTIIGSNVSKIIKKMIPKKTIMHIRNGTLKGYKWFVASTDLSCTLGTYEPFFSQKMEKNLEKVEIFYDIGAHVGYYTLLASEIIGNNGKVVSFEPLPRNIDILFKHLTINNVKNVKVIDAAVLDKCGTINFEDVEKSSMSRVTNNSNLNSITVKTVKIDALISKQLIPPPDLMKIDVEGAEFLVLKGAKKTIKEYHPKIFLEIHGKDLLTNCINFLKTEGYALEIINKEGMIRLCTK